MTVVFGNFEEVVTHTRVPTDIECGECLRKMSLFSETNCLACQCGELRWLV